jgi:hypothetical protein
MSSSRTVDFLTEAALIVVSILVAFAVDASWEKRGDALRVQALIDGLHNDFVAVQQELDDALVEHEALERASARWVMLGRSAPPTPALTATADTLLTDLLWQGTFDAPLGTLEALLNAGDLDLIDDPALVRALTSWSAVVNDLTDREARIAQHAADRLIPYLTERVPIADLLWSEVDPRGYERTPWDRRHTEGYTLLGDPVFEGYASTAWFLAKDAIQASVRVRKEATEICRLLTPLAREHPSGASCIR